MSGVTETAQFISQKISDLTLNFFLAFFISSFALLTIGE